MPEPALSSVALRGGLGGILMGLANLVPGISGGTMLLATGVYRRFVDAVAQVTTLRFRLPSMLLLASIALTAGLTILLLAGPVEALVTRQRWAMYSLFIGLTLGGVPVVWGMARPGSFRFGAGTAMGFLVMAIMWWTKDTQATADSGSVILAVAGVAAASAMILPGVSGAYLFLVLGQYERILAAIDRVKHGAFAEAMPVIVPVGIGVLLGIVLVSNLVRWTLQHFEQVTLGVLMGLLFGSVLGIYPFARDAATAGRLVVGVALAGAGFFVTRGIARIGRA